MTDSPERGEIDLDDLTLIESVTTVNDYVRAVAVPLTRELNRREADALLRSYLEPGCFPQAVRRLAERHLLVLVGAEEIGKRLGALALLSRMSLAESTITVLSPATGAPELISGTEYHPGRAYLLHDWITASTDRVELANLARKLAELGSYLVITRNGEPSPATEVEHAWTAPPAGELFDFCLRTLGGAPDAGQDALAAARRRARALPTPGEVTGLVTRMVMAGEPACDEVAAWFDTKPPMHQVRAVAALVFAHRLPEPDFRAQLARLEEIHQSHELGPRPPMGPLPLIAHRAGQVVFRVPRHRAQVLAELVARYGFWLWQPLREWIRTLARQGLDLQIRAAEGVALLAGLSPKEAYDLLDAWASGRPTERLAAAHALSFMSAEDTLAPEALRLALSWAGDADRGSTSAVALGGGLAIRYPADAVRTLRGLASCERAGVVARQSLALMVQQAAGHDDAQSRVVRRLAAAAEED
ncbi:hypothetical protein HII36_25355 [Nonomuraea sp. NN258]|uniref:hypothetical protein n=1 Tax=Nonomuraea antri TaxID=2730852 RepID=UPI0015683CD4|nr:hypothetical protein [Nonomuraea antri]NRQ35127.1 hypothetical protein [Nonomuraea antri]